MYIQLIRSTFAEKNMTTQRTSTIWTLDPTHSEVQFKVKHLVISTVTGYFRKFDGSIQTYGDHFDGADVRFTVEVNSIDTNVPDRDAHLKSDDFFAADRFPQMVFEGKLKSVRDNLSQLHGQLTIRDNTKPMVLEVEYGGQMVDFYGQTKVGFEVSGSINRKDYGLMWSAVTEAGGIVVADDVKIHFNVQFVKK